METSLCVVSVVPWSGASGAMLSLSDHKHHLVQAFPLQMKKLRCREGGALAYRLECSPAIFFLGRTRIWFGNVGSGLDLHFMPEGAGLVSGWGPCPRSPSTG